MFDKSPAPWNIELVSGNSTPSTGEVASQTTYTHPVTKDVTINVKKWGNGAPSTTVYTDPQTGVKTVTNIEYREEPQTATAPTRRDRVLSVVDRIAQEAGNYSVKVSPDGTVSVGKNQPVAVQKPNTGLSLPKLPEGITYNHVALGVGAVALLWMIGRR